MTKQLNTLTAADIINVDPFTVPKGTYRGELYNGKDYVGNIWLINGRGYVGVPEGSRTITKMLPGSFDPKAFVRNGGAQLSANQYVKFWNFK